MLNPEAAHRELRTFRTPEGQRRSVGDLPPELRAIGFNLMGRRSEGKRVSDWDARAKVRSEAAAELASLGEKQRLRIFAALFPRIAAHVESAWRLHEHLPYQTGYERRAFRAAGPSAATLAARTEWLTSLIDHLAEYDQDIRWVAAWTPYLASYDEQTLGVLLAGAIEGGGPDGDAVFDILAASARGEHEIGAMGRHVTSGLLCASRPDGWELMERLLLAAQRQEGLRQAILEGVDQAHPEAFRRMLRLIVANDLQRFSSVIRAFDVWFGLTLEQDSAAVVKACLCETLRYLEDPTATREALSATAPRTVYAGLWSLAFRDAHTAISAASRLLGDASPDRRLVAAFLLGQLQLPEARAALLPALDDPDMKVAWAALEGVAQQFEEEAGNRGDSLDLFEPLERLLARCPRKSERLELKWAGLEWETDRQVVANHLVEALGKRPPTLLIPHLAAMDSSGRSDAVGKLATVRKPDALVRETLFAMVGDSSEWVRSQILDALQKHRVGESEAQGLERLFTRKSGDLRRAVLTLLLKQPDEGVIKSAERLLGRDAGLRLGGLELLRQMVEEGRVPEKCRALASDYRAGREALPDQEQELLGLLLDRDRAAPTLDDALGLMDPTKRTPPQAPRAAPGIQLRTDAARALLTGLDGTVHKHRETAIELRDPDEDDEGQQLLGDMQWGFPVPDPGLAPGEDLARLPLREVWEAWWAARREAQRDADGFELLRAVVAQTAAKPAKLKHEHVVGQLLEWMLRLYPPPGVVDFLLDAAETSLTEIPPKVNAKAPTADWDDDWREDEQWTGWVSLCRRHRELHRGEWKSAQLARFWKLLRWIDEPGLPIARLRPPLEDGLAAFEAGAANQDDLFDLLLGPRPEESEYTWGPSFEELEQHSGRKPTAERLRSPAFNEIVSQCRDRILEVELGRGELTTVASKAALSLRWSGGAGTLLRLMQAMGKARLVRGYISDDEERSAVFSHLIRVSFPAEGDTPEAFAEKTQAAQTRPKRLIDIAFYAPQWASHVEAALQWPQFAEAVWWIHAHTKDDQWTVDQEIRETWTAQVSERTPLSAQSLVDGAVDVQWFRQVRASLGDERWKLIDEGAKYASGGNGHKRAQLFADAMLGRISRDELVKRIEEKRNQDAVRALGLLPLPEGEARDEEVLDRYRIIQEFVHGSRQFGSQRQSSEKLAATVAMENLARGAGYPDPVRLEWAMEAHAIADLAAGSISVSSGEVTLTLSINDWGEPDLVVTRAGKTIKAVPASAKKDPGITALQARKKEVERQGSRMRLSLESAMCRGDAFSGRELVKLMQHPVLAPMLRSLVFTADGKSGYPVEGGRALEDAHGKITKVALEDALRVAHPHDLFLSGDWHGWQRDCFHRERIQPFKQVFRELYVLTEAEQTSGCQSARYSGHQVNSRQARALLGKRGWVSNPEEGDVRKTFHREDLTAWIGFDYGYTTPAEVEGLTLEAVGFSRRGKWEAVALTDIPPRIFSEVMRDVDLIVSVAHQGGVDPEATASTVEMRAALLRETCGLMKLDNVRLQNNHAMVDGKLGTYSVHLGSAIVHRQPGGHLCIVPVHSQHRGRLFLPFADNDPRTAEVVSKVLLLARDDQIKDPTILEQIFAQTRRSE